MGVKKLKLNENMGEIVKAHADELDAESWQQYKALGYQR